MPHSPHIARQAFLRGAIAILPLSLAVAPWGLLAGSMAIEANLSAWEGQGLSAIVFAGAAQLVAIGMLKGGANLASILLTTLLLTSQHLLYGLSMRPVLSNQPLRWRLGLGFLLTDEFFALTSHYDQQQFNRWYALGVGLTFYVAWNLFTLAGIVLGQNIPHLDQLGLDFSIVATFVALCSVLFSAWHWETALVAAGLLGMSAGFVCQKWFGGRA